MATLIASEPQDYASFGYAVAIDGDTAVVGAWYEDQSAAIDAGSAYIFIRSGELWIQQAALAASDAAVGDNFGSSVAVSGDTVVVGALREDNAGGSNAGSAYVFVRTGGVWTEQAKLTALDAAPDDRLGQSASISGDTVAAGAHLDDHAGGNSSGSAYVFVRNGIAWNQQAKLTASDAAAGDFFGYSVGVSGETLIVGADRDDHAGGANAGSAYVFTRTGTLWTEQIRLAASDAAPGDEFAYSVALDGDTAIVGAWNDHHAGLEYAGSAYVFVRVADVWSQQAKLIAFDAASWDYFGISVALSGDTALIGSWFSDPQETSDAGSAYVFGRSVDVWSSQGKLAASDAVPNDYFGVSVGLSDTLVIAGAERRDSAGWYDAGSAYGFDLAPPFLPGDLNDDAGVDLVDADILVEVLLGIDIDPAHVARADVDCSGTPDGRDVRAFTEAVLN